MAYPELVSRGVSKTRKFKWLVKVGASIYQTPDLKKNLGWGGGFRATKKKPGYATAPARDCRTIRHLNGFKNLSEFAEGVYCLQA